MVDLNLYLVTFNCGRSLVQPEVFGSHFFDNWEAQSKPTTHLPDVIVLNLQELAPISYAFLGGSFVKAYFQAFRNAIAVAVSNHNSSHAEDETPDQEYSNIISKDAGLTAIMVFVRKDLTDKVKSIQLANVGVGVSEMGNKGAIGARIGWKLETDEDPMYLTFVSAHLAPFESEVERRNEDYKQIVRGLVFTSLESGENKRSDQSEEDVPLLEETSTTLSMSKTVGLYSEDSHIFFAGDLNYRTSLNKPTEEDQKLYPQPTKDLDDPKHYTKLLAKDQLQQQLREKKTLHGLTEQPIAFPPTYKYKQDSNKAVILDEDTDHWDWATHRWPSWCDRIFYSATEDVNVKAGKYLALPHFTTSDHRPVSLCVAVPLAVVSDNAVVQEAPMSIDPHWKARRSWARKKELVVGASAYLGMTWEGNGLMLGTVLVAAGGIWLSRSF